MRLTNCRVLAALIALVMLAAGCGGGSDTATEGVATLEADTAPTEGESAAGESASGESAELDADEAALAFSACMRDEGLEFPDIGVDAEGRLDLRSGLDGIERGEEFRAAMDVCQPIIEDAGFGRGQRAGVGENVEIQDALVEFSAFVRAAGYDVGDIELGGPRPGQDADAGDEPPDGERGRGQGQGGFGNRSARFANQLGLDYEDPEVATVIDDCVTVVDEAFAAAGIGRP